MTLTAILVVGALFVAWALWMAVPFLPAVHELRRGAAVQPLFVPAHDERDLRFFATRFRTVVLDALGEGPPEGDVSLPNGSRAWVIDRLDALTVVEGADAGLLFARSPIAVAERAELPVEAYAQQAFSAGAGSTVRAVLGEADVVLERGARVLRWVHAAEELDVGPGCLLYGRATAGRRLRLRGRCTFESLMAPRVEHGDPVEPPALPPPPRLVDPTTLGEVEAGRCLARGDVTLEDGTLIAVDLVVTGTLRVGRRCVVEGSVKAHRDVILGEGSVLRGGVVARGRMVVGPGCRVAGPVVAERSVRVAPGSCIGRLDAPTTVSAPEVTFEEGAVSFGAIHAERGEVVAADVASPAA